MPLHIIHRHLPTTSINTNLNTVMNQTTVQTFKKCSPPPKKTCINFKMCATVSIELKSCHTLHYHCTCLHNSLCPSARTHEFSTWTKYEFFTGQILIQLACQNSKQKYVIAAYYITDADDNHVNVDRFSKFFHWQIPKKNLWVSETEKSTSHSLQAVTLCTKPC